MFLVMAGYKFKSCTDLVEALGEVAVLRKFEKVRVRPKLVLVDYSSQQFVEFTDQQVSGLLLWLERRVAMADSDQ